MDALDNRLIFGIGRKVRTPTSTVLNDPPGVVEDLLRQIQKVPQKIYRFFGSKGEKVR
jgi:hypothetical protein